ncbi:hypothetical protein [Clostridium uliginosum]|uniref:Lipoprotein n=1 Tax=Clostridium uliginosum TaxID=119641 RepID=A0A1I1L671_9CLOT|nr:hypothetical protein [Clostridium uliginosum]SFC68529.1 hypothetical protein SAMN05421842_10799 [Clostridium uliginosum]
MKKIISLIMTIIMILGLIGCKNNNLNEETVNLYDSKQAIEIAKEYLIKLQDGDVEGAKSLCTSQFSANQKENPLGDFKIQSFKINKTVEGGNKSSVVFDAIRGEDNRPNSNLDMYNVYVVKEDDKYKINDLKTQDEVEVYNDQNRLRIKQSSQGQSNLLLRLSDVPKEVYNKESGSLEKIESPAKDFSSAGLSYTGNKVAYATTDGKDSFVGVLYVKESVGTITPNKGDNIEDSSKGANITEDLEKSQTEKMSNFGVLKECKIERLIFNSLEDELLISYKKLSKGTGLKIFNIESGELSALNIENTFPTDKYNIRVIYTSEEDITIKVSLLEGISEAEDGKSGIYIINTKKATITQK